MNTVVFTVFTLDGEPVSETPKGTFRLARSPGDLKPGRRLEFAPTPPTNATLDNGGFRPGREYLVTVPTDPGDGAHVLRDTWGQELARPFVFSVRTPEGTTREQLFRKTK